MSHSSLWHNIGITDELVNDNSGLPLSRTSNLFDIQHKKLANLRVPEVDREKEKLLKERDKHTLLNGRLSAEMKKLLNTLPFTEKELDKARTLYRPSKYSRLAKLRS
jgi:hypothetical protein